MQENRFNTDKKKKPVTVYIGNLSYTKTEGQIKRIFAKYGKVGFVRIVLDEKTKKSKGIAFVQMFNPNSAVEAIKVLDGKEIDGRTLKVSIAQERKELKPVHGKTEKLKLKEDTKDSSKVKKSRRQKSGLNQLFDYLQKENRTR